MAVRENGEIPDSETCAIALRFAAKLMALKALKARRKSALEGGSWLAHAASADILAEEYEAKGIRP